MALKPQRIRDPVHNLIEFGVDQVEYGLWQVIQTREFQRLRRIRQLGFSELVFPGATHTRFAHSIGVFHTARQLLRMIETVLGRQGHQYKKMSEPVILAAALLHDVGHGMFSHAFEAIGKEMSWPMARHENVSQDIIRDSELSNTLDKFIQNGFSQNVADVIAREVPQDLYGSIVSSQFDADRLDYMQRDRLMSGVQSSGVDPVWLLANLEIAEVETGADDSPTGKVETLVLGPKAIQTAESYVLALFHLYPNLYLHKSTRGVEVLFQALLRRLIQLQTKGVAPQSGLPENHPLVRFFGDPTNRDFALQLDDTVFWGALPMLCAAPDPETMRLAIAVRDRRLTRCLDLKALAESLRPRGSDEPYEKYKATITLAYEATAKKLKDLQKELELKGAPSRFLVDQYKRNPYKRFQDSNTLLNQILVRDSSGTPRDMVDFSPVVRGAEIFTICRVYVFRDDTDAESMIGNIMRTSLTEASS